MLALSKALHNAIYGARARWESVKNGYHHAQAYLLTHSIHQTATQHKQICYQYQKKHSPTHHPDHHPVFISFFHLPRSIASSLFKLRAWQSFCTTSFHVLFGLPLGLELSTSYSIHFFTQSVSSFRSTCPNHCDLFCCTINIISSIPSLSLNSLLGTLS